MTPFVDISAVSLNYGEGGGGTLALEDASLRINRGEFVAVVGPSGCGKSTLLKLVSGLVLPTKGGVIVADREVAAPLSIVGMAFQNPIMLPWRTTLDNVLLPLEIVEPHASRFRSERADMWRRRVNCCRSSGSPASRHIIPGSSPAACSSGRRFAVR